MTFQEQHFMNEVSKYLDNLNIIEDRNIALETIYTILDTTLDRHAPIKTKRVKHVHIPTWLTDEIILAIHNRDKLHKQGEMEEYNVLSNKSNALIKKRKTNVFNNAIQDGKSTKHLWNNIKSVSNNSDKNFVIPTSISKDTHDDVTCVLNSLNQHFIDMSDMVRKSKIDKDSFQDLENKLNYKLKENMFELKYITSCKVIKYIDKLNVNKSTGSDGIGPNITLF